MGGLTRVNIGRGDIGLNVGPLEFGVTMPLAGIIPLVGEADRLFARAPVAEDSEEIDDVNNAIRFTIRATDVGRNVIGSPFGENLKKIKNAYGTIWLTARPGDVGRTIGLTGSAINGPVPFEPAGMISEVRRALGQPDFIGLEVVSINLADLAGLGMGGVHDQIVDAITAVGINEPDPDRVFRDHFPR